MVERRRDPDDRRRHAVVLTEAGEQASRRLTVLRAQVEARVLAGLDPDERRPAGRPAPPGRQRRTPDPGASPA